MRALAFTAVVSAILLLYGCTKPLGDLSFSESEKPQYGVPLLQTTFTLRDALQGYDFVGTLRDDDGLRLVRADTIFNDRVIKSVTIPDLAAPLLDTVNSISLNSVGFDVPIDKLGLQSGRFIYILQSADTEPLTVTISLPNISTPTQDPLSITSVVPPGGNVIDTLQLAGAVITLNANNDFTLNYTARTPSNEARVLQFAIVQIEALQPSFAEGGLDSFPYLLGATTLNTDFLGTFTPGSASVEDASVTVEITNTAPVPLRFDGLDSYAELRNGTQLPFTSSLVGGVALGFPAMSADTVRTTFVLDESNSTLIQAVRQFPDSLIFELQAVVNPERLDQTFRIERFDRVIGRFIFDVPLAVDFDGFEVTEDFNFGQIETIDKLASANLKVVTSNAFGLGARAQVYLLNEDGVVSDSLLAEEIDLVLPGELDDSGNVNAATDLVASIPLSREQLLRLSEGPRARVKLTLRTPEGMDVYARLDYTNSIDLSVGLDFQLLGE